MVLFIVWLGHYMEGGTIRPPDTYMQKNWRVEKPANVGELYRFLGMVVWIVQHLPWAILICDLLYKLFPNDRRSKRRKLEWTDDALETWDELKVFCTLRTSFRCRISGGPL
jgi:hypothetical protein